jgi:hypothetical protein
LLFEVWIAAITAFRNARFGDALTGFQLGYWPEPRTHISRGRSELMCQRLCLNLALRLEGASCDADQSQAASFRSAYRQSNPRRDIDLHE